MENSVAQVVEDCAAMREGPRADYTIARAIDDARWLRATPDAVISPARCKQIIETLLGGLERSPSYLKAMSLGQEVFVLMQQDRAAPAAIVAWADAAAEHGCPAEKLSEAYGISGRWTHQPLALTKWPD